MSAPAIPLRRYTAFNDIAEALSSFIRHGWRLPLAAPPVGATGEPDVDATLAAIFGRLVRLETVTAQLELLFLAAESNERHAAQIEAAAHAFGAAHEGWSLLAGVHQRIAEELRIWIDELADAADGEAA